MLEATASTRPDRKKQHIGGTLTHLLWLSSAVRYEQMTPLFWSVMLDVFNVGGVSRTRVLVSGRRLLFEVDWMHGGERSDGPFRQNII
jgi:hypothetical protein